MKNNIIFSGLAVALFLFNTAHAEPTVWYVHPDSSLNSIQAGLDSCANNDIVLVASGTYFENIVWPNTQGIYLRSESGPSTTIIDGGGTDRVILIDTGVDTATIVDGFTIQNGSSNLGSGIYCSLNSSPVIINNTITANVSSNYAGGIACFESSPVIRDNLITNNTATSSGGGGISCWDAGPIIYGNTITNNTANWGGGIDCTGTPSPHISKNTVVGNTANTGAGLYSGWGGSAPFIDSCTISNNIGDGVYCDASDAVLHYNNITDNSGYGVQNVSPTNIIDATYNWWGDPSGPGGVGPGTGDEVSSWVNYDPWLDHPVCVIEQKNLTSIKNTHFGATIFKGPLLLAGSKKCRIFDIAGRVVSPDKIKPGIYFIEVERKITRKVVKVK